MTGGESCDEGFPLRGKGICAYYDQMAVMTKWAVANAPGFQTIGVSGLPYADSGASAFFEEVGAMLSTAVFYLRAMEERGLSVDETAAHMRFTVSIGANLFLEIAKIRALRELWAIIVKRMRRRARSCQNQAPGPHLLLDPPRWIPGSTCCALRPGILRHHGRRGQ